MIAAKHLRSMDTVGTTASVLCLCLCLCLGLIWQGQSQHGRNRRQQNCSAPEPGMSVLNLFHLLGPDVSDLKSATPLLPAAVPAAALHGACEAWLCCKWLSGARAQPASVGGGKP